MTGWRIYFWIYLAFSILAILGLLGQIASNPAINLLGIITQVILAAGLYDYVFKKKLLPAKNWQIILYLAVIFWLVPVFTQSSVIFNSTFILFTLISALLDLPSFIAMYRLSKS